MSFLSQSYDSLFEDCNRHPKKIPELLQNFAWNRKELKKIPLPTLNSSQAYSRAPLVACPRGELIAMHWQIDQFCAPHNHGHSSGWVLLLEGNFIEREWIWKNNRLELRASQEFIAPQLLEVDVKRIHDMKTTTGGISIHLYFPSIQQMKVYDLERKETLVVSNQCGAWVPEDQQDVISYKSWNSHE